MEAFESKSLRQKWFEGDLLLASMWILGKWAEKDELELAETAKTPISRAQHSQQAKTFGFASNVGAAVLAYRSFKTHPKLVTVLGIFWLGSSAFVSAASVGAKSSPLLHALIDKPSRPELTGWEPWERHEYRDVEGLSGWGIPEHREHFRRW
jgi:hypothetical protein